MNENIQRFDAEAASWDDNPRRMQLVADIADTLIRELPLNRTMNVLDFGCGTGALAMRLAPLVGSITGADTSRGMLEVFKDKAALRGLDSVRLLQVAPDGYAVLTGVYDLIISSMTLHHIEHIIPLLAHFHSILRPGGCLAIADLDPDDGVFHGEEAEVFHSGFDRDYLCGLFSEVGFEAVRSVPAAETVKPAADGVMRRFTLSLTTGRRS